MRTIEITRVDDLREGDYVTLRWEHGEGVQVALEGPMWNRMVGGYTVTDARFVSATREVPEWEPGTAGTATVRGVEGVRVMRVMPNPTAFGCAWFSVTDVPGGSKAHHWHGEDDVTSFVPDDAESLRRSLEVAREGHRKEVAWRAQIRRMGAEVDRLNTNLDNARAEVERWKAEAEMLTAKVDRLMPLQEHENECSYRQRSEKAEAEVERLRAARQVPTRKQIVGALWPDTPEGVRSAMTDLGAVERVLALIEQGGSNLRGEAESK